MVSTLLRRHGFALALALLAGVLLSAGAPRWLAREPGALNRPAPAAAAPDPAADPQGHMRAARQAEIRQRFEQAVAMLHARQYEHAATALDRVLQLSPRLPEAHVNLGFALLGLARLPQAEAAFQRAIDLKADQANAYYGLAMAQEAQGDLPAALGAMRAYLHLSPADDAHRAKARAALWEWEQRMGRHAPTGAASIPGFGNR
jgi:tetratricopeptide (TPR) repeat protein